jgi:hypothetical protein
MNLTLSIFDLFAYTVPGSLYLALLAYVSDRVGWLDLSGASNLNTTVLLIGAALVCYLLGHLTYRLGRFVDGVLATFVAERHPQHQAAVPRPCPHPEGQPSG